MIFVDTGYYRGLVDKKDIHHKNCLKIQKFLSDTNETTVINTTVLVETLNRIKGSGNDVSEAYHELCEENIFVPLNDDDYSKSLQINGWYNNSINFNDCTIIKTMMDLNITRIVSFDGGFRKIGRYEVISNV